MYNCFEFNEILSAVERALTNLNPTDHTIPIPDIKDLIDLLKIIVENSTFMFTDKMYKQKVGVPMGGSSSAELADLRMYEILKNILYQFEHGNKILTCLGYRDDGFIIYKGSEEEIHSLFNLANTVHPHLKFTYEFSKTELVFLDTVIYKGERFKNEGTLDIKTYFKPTETFQYLHRKSSHPTNIFIAFIKGEIMRYIRNTSSNTELNKQIESFKSRLLKRDYNKSEINEIIENNRNLNRNKLLEQSVRKRENTLTMVTKYNSAIRKLKIKVLKHWKLLSKDEECANLFKQKPIIAYKRNKNLQELVTRARVTP